MRRIGVSVFCLTALLIITETAVASPQLRINESATKVSLEDERVNVALAVDNLRVTATAARIRIELVDTLNRVRASATLDETIKPGQSTLAVRLPFELSTLNTNERRLVLWYRLRYRLSYNSERGTAADSINGIISVSEITPDLFELKALKPMIAAEGSRYRVQARALHPFSERPLKDVKVDAELKIEAADGNFILKASAVSDGEGYAVFNFDLPPKITSSEGEIRLTGRRNGVTQEAEGTVRVDRAARIVVNTDKPIYQPGQMLHVRALVLGPSKRAMAGADLTLKIQDPERTVVYRAVVKTSRFGIASANWPIPENARLGDYEIYFDVSEDDEQDVYYYRHKVRISRYELPNFTVNVKPDRGYYLAGQNAEIVVRGDYLFGQPVTRARARVVQEESREWNYREQKWEIEEGAKYEGELDQSGRFVAHVDLAKAHEKMSRQDYGLFKDVSFAAYITDLTTNRTEQRRFDLRVTKEAIHVYVLDDNRQSEKLPQDLYITTFYPDGAPAECDVTISELVRINKGRDGSDEAYERPLRVIKTNRYGVAKVNNLTLAKRDDDDPSLSIKASDGKGHVGHRAESFWLSSYNYLRVETDRTIYRAGEPVKVLIRSSVPDGKVFVDVARDWKVIESEALQLHGGRASITLPYRNDFKGELTIAAYTHDNSMTLGSRTVIYPHNRELKVDVKTAQSVYRPGEEASATLSVKSPDGRAAESTLGISVIDRSVDERARTDLEFGSRYDFYRAFQRIWGDDESIGSVSRSSLDHIDLSKPIPSDLDLVAEVLLRRGGYIPDTFDSSDYRIEQNEAFRFLFGAQFKPISAALKARYTRAREYPKDAAKLNLLLAQFGIDFSHMRDPWGTPYRVSFGINRDRDTMTVTTAGADKRFDTDDDSIVFQEGWPYFAGVGEKINSAIREYHSKTGGFIRDFAALKRELLRQGLDFDLLRDRWGKLYTVEFGVSKTDFTVMIKSGGKDRRIETTKRHGSDDFIIWTAKIDYLADTRVKIDAALAAYFKSSSRFPQSEAEVALALKQSGIDFGAMRDPWGNRYYVAVKTVSRYGDSVKIYTYSRYKGEPSRRTEITAVTQQVHFVYLRSNGEDGRQGTVDDFDAASFSRIVTEQSSADKQAKPSLTTATLLDGAGVITGTVTDVTGAVVPGTKVKAIHSASSQVFEAVTSDEGRFLLRNLPVGLYEVHFDSPGFKSAVIASIPVRASNVTELVAALETGAVTETVMVTSGAAEVQTETSASVVTELKPVKTSTLPKQAAAISTPRLREYFPETLLWQPSLDTDSQGRAQLKFKLADNITTWKISVIASTVEGEIGMAEQDLRAFQPFFVEHDPPRVLTEGDEISLPVVVRNYLDKSQKVELEIKPENWFALFGPARKQTEVSASDAVRETFGFKVVSSITDGKQRVTATGADASDAIEKAVTAHPDGQEVTETASQVFDDASSLQINIPETAIKNSARAELKIYPNLLAHIVEGIESIMQRPYGCGEQTISSAYPSLLVLRYYKQRGEDVPSVARKARAYLERGYQRLLNYRNEEGGFTYWGRGEADTALTAYALRFLGDARDLIAIDEDVIEDARKWLIKKQREDGSWTAPARSGAEDRARTSILTSLVARSLAQSAKNKPRETADTDSIEYARASAALKRAIDYLAARSAEIDEPYLIASTTLAAFDANDTNTAQQSIKRLRALARSEGDTSYWALESNTPFYGWGLAGRIEATALAVEALARDCGMRNADCGLSESATIATNRSEELKSQSSNKESSANPQSAIRIPQLISRGLLFLIRQKDRYGVWHSSQATVNVLEAMTALLANKKMDAHISSAPQSAEVFVNGKRVASAQMPPEDQPSSPVAIDLSEFLATGANRVEIRKGRASQATAQLVGSYYSPWIASKTEAPRRSEAEVSSALRFRVGFNRSEAAIGNDITCRVEAERIGFKGYGMMLAEIGMPPGADIDRASLERAITESGYSISQYDVLPDRVVFYLWPEAGGVKFEFKFRPRFGLAAQSAPSTLYDYYNPEARVVIAPTRFIVK